MVYFGVVEKKKKKFLVGRCTVGKGRMDGRKEGKMDGWMEQIVNLLSYLY